MTGNNKASLWGNALLEASEQSPFDFMEEQAESLREATGGILWGEVKPFVKDGITYHAFQIASQHIEDYSCLLLRTAYAKRVFPLYIYDYSQSDEYEYVPKRGFHQILDPQPGTVEVQNKQGTYFAPKPDFVAHDFNEFEKQFAKILGSKGTRAIIQSLLLQSNSHAE